MKLHTINIAGNLHDATTYLNTMDLADYVIHLDYTGSATIAVLKVPEGLIIRLRKNNPSYQADVLHDFPKDDKELYREYSTRELL